MTKIKIVISNHNRKDPKVHLPGYIMGETRPKKNESTKTLSRCKNTRNQK